MINRKPIMSESTYKIILGDMAEKPEYTQKDVDIEFEKINSEVKAIRKKWMLKILPPIAIIVFAVFTVANFFLIGATTDTFSQEMVQKYGPIDLTDMLVQTALVSFLVATMFSYAYSDLGRCFFFIKPRRDLAEMNVRLEKGRPLLKAGKITTDQWFFYASAVLTKSVTRY